MMSCPRSREAVVLIALQILVGHCQYSVADGSSFAPLAVSEWVPPSSWVSELFYRALANFTVRNVGSTACQKQTDMYETNLQNYTSWAVRMAESWDRRPIGVLGGNMYHFGIYDECVDVHYPVRGQYCLSEVKLMTTSSVKNFSFNRTEDLDNFGNNHTWHTLLGWVDYPDQVQRNILNLGICIPDSCTASNLQISLQKELDKVFSPEQIKAQVKVDPIMCTVSGDMYPYNTSYYVTISFLGLLIMICFCATLHNFIVLSYHRNKKDAHEIPYTLFYSFSFIESGKELLKYDKNNELNIMNGLKLLVMLVVLFGHRFMYFVGNPMNYSKFLENILISGPDILLTSMNVVDPFFFISGYIMYVTVSPILLKTETVWKKIISPIIYRIIRILPAYCVVMAIVAHIVPHYGDGPLWPQKTWHEAEKCKNYWWTNLLFISNLIDVKYQCLLMSWYISCDVQFYIIGIIVVYVYMTNSKYGVGLVSVLLAVSLSVPFIVTFLKKSDGLLKVYIPFLEDPRSSVTFNESYRPSYMRGVPFLVGLGMGFIIPKLKETKLKFSQITVFGGTFIATIICLWIQFYGTVFYQRNRPYYPIEQALYSTISHCTWPVLGMFICLFHFTTGYGLLAKIFDNKFVVPLGRLSYSVFLVNLPVMMISQSSQRVPSYVSGKTLFNVVVHDIFNCYLASLMLYLVVEAPFGNLARFMFGRGTKKSRPGTNEPVENTVSIEIPNKEISHL